MIETVHVKTSRGGNEHDWMVDYFLHHSSFPTIEEEIK